MHIFYLFIFFRIDQLEIDNACIQNTKQHKYGNKHFSTIHGISYLTTNQTHWLAKIFWCIVLVISAITCSTFISYLVKLWSDSPTLLHVIAAPRPIWDIPFPAFTICPAVKTKTEKFNFTDIYHQVTANKGSIHNLPEDQ